jgi:hypothetical protein
MSLITGALLHRRPTSHSSSLLRDTTERTHCIKPNDVNLLRVLLCRLYEGCPECIEPFWISREPVTWPWCNLSSSPRRPYCASVNSHCPGASQSAVRRRWLSLCIVGPSHSQWPSEQIRFITTMRLPILQLSCGLFWHHPGLSAPLQLRFGSLRLLAFRKAKIAVEREVICEYGCHTVHKLRQQRLTANWLAPRESDCSRMHSKVSSDWLPSYIKATRPVLAIFKMAGYIYIYMCVCVCVCVTVEI